MKSAPATSISRLDSWAIALQRDTLANDARRAETFVPGAPLSDRFVGRLESRFLRSFGHAANLGGLLGGPSAARLAPSSAAYNLWRVIHMGVRSLIGVAWGLAVMTAISPWLLVGACLRAPTVLTAPRLPSDHPAISMSLLDELGCEQSRRGLVARWGLSPKRVVYATQPAQASWRTPAGPPWVDFSRAAALGDAAPLPPQWTAALEGICQIGMAAAAKHLRFGAGGRVWRMEPHPLQRAPEACWSVARPVTDQRLVRVECHALWDEPIRLMAEELRREPKRWLYPHPLHVTLTLDVDQPAQDVVDDPRPWSVAPGGEPVIDPMAYVLRDQLRATALPGV